MDRSGAVYAGTSPDGKVYRIENGKATEYFAPKARYIWSLAVGPDGALYVGTGDQGKIFRVDSAGKGEVYYETGQSHITGLAVDSQSRLLAGTEPNGILYRISAKDKAFVLYDANLPEIRAIVPMPDGTVYAAALGGSVAKRAQSANQAAQGDAGGEQRCHLVGHHHHGGSPGCRSQAAGPDQARAAAARRVQASTPQVSTQFTPVVDITGVEKTAVYRINPDNTVETLWSSKEENVYDLLALEKQILFSTDQDGRIYGLSPDRRVTLVTQTNEGETTRLLPGEHSVLAATGNMGRIFRLGEVSGPARLLRSARARFRHRLALGQPRAGAPTCRPASDDSVPHALRQLRQARPHLERLVRSAHQFRRQPHHQPQRALHPVEAGNDRRRRRHAHARTA